MAALIIDYWETDSGTSPVLEFMQDQPQKIRAKIQWVIDFFETKGYDLLGTPLLKKLRKGLYELRIQTSRIILIIKRSTAYLLHGFIKKSRRTPSNEIKTALARKAILECRLSLGSK